MTEPKTPLLERARKLLQEGDYRPMTTQFAADVGSWLYDYGAEDSALQARVKELEERIKRLQKCENVRPAMTPNRFEEIKANHFGLPAEYRSNAVDELIREIERLRAGLVEARGLIEFFHGKPGWEIYEGSPEMKRIDAILEGKNETP